MMGKLCEGGRKVDNCEGKLEENREKTEENDGQVGEMKR